ncbi:superoxide dismutase [Streptomyces sp. B1866]|uniref:superoxide dismutase n=1 Tax=Streptomyces sp. B1866 TaxID=3075431 RepID=UPI00288EEE2A|nr:superoxide dismutase [Streptomyces sp. B1866]MDT3400100.1 superoxide dismutase [Streptomyces sp. B1866]
MRGLTAALVSLALGLCGVPSAAAGAAPRTDTPAGFPLPAGFQPEGIAIGAWPTAYLGSRADGRIWQVDLRTGRGRVLSPGPGTPALGVKVDSAHRRLFVAGGTGGDARVVDLRTGAVLARYRFADADTFVNDLVLTRKAVWFTDSRRPVLYRLPLGRHGELPAPDRVQRLPLTGDLVVEPGTVNANGIVTTPDGRGLVVGQTSTGRLFRVDPATGAARAVDLGGAALPRNDGLLRRGTRLYAVQNRLNLLTRVELTADGGAGRVVGSRTDPRFDVPTTVAAWQGRLYLVNGRLTTPPTPDTAYDAVAVPTF